MYINKAQEPSPPATATAASPSGSGRSSGRSRRINLLAIFLLSSAPTASAYSLALPLSSSPSLPPLLPLIGRQHSSWRARGPSNVANSLLAYRTFDADTASEAIGEPSVQSMDNLTASHRRKRFSTTTALTSVESVGDEEEALEATGTSAAAGSQFSMLPKRMTSSRPQPQPQPQPQPSSRLRSTPPSITRATTADEFRTSVLDESSALVAVHFVADWCALCKKTAPSYERWAAKERGEWKQNQQQQRQREVKFVEVPLNKATSDLVVDALQIPTLPYFQLYHPVRGLIERGSVGRRNELHGFAKLVEEHSTAKEHHVNINVGGGDGANDRLEDWSLCSQEVHMDKCPKEA